MADDKLLEYLLDLDGQIMVINSELGLWVKFDVRKAVSDINRPNGIKYSFTLHNRNNKRILGFDNAHAIDQENKMYDHWHKNEKDIGRPYKFLNAAKLLEDFWAEVEKSEIILRGSSKDDQT